MEDCLAPVVFNKRLSAVRSKNTKPEIIVRKGLWSKGFRYRVNDNRLPGHPDIVLRKYRTCIFVNGCFWHGHEGCKCYKIPKSNRDFWVAKVKRNKERDKEEQRKLAQLGWHCIIVWECELTPQKRGGTLDSIAYTLNHIWLKDRGAYPDLEENHLKAAEK